MTYFLGIDAGGSNCRARLIDAAGATIGEGRSGTANARIGIDALYDTLKDTADQAVAQAGLTPSQRAQIRAGMGIAGITRPGVREALGELDFGFASVAYATDAQIANLGAHGGEDGAILIIGTGSAAQLRVHGEDFTIGGYGFPISDEGSGAALGLSAMRHALRALDGRTRRTPLSAAVTERFNHDTAQAIAWMDQATPRDYGAFAPLVMDYAEADDAIARSIVEDAAAHIERFIETIFERGATRCTLVGGLAPRMKPWLRSRTVERLSDPLGDSLDGALRLAGYRGPA
ncbi:MULTISPECIES: BadF/BadG/BcrA/BcrD ATPase family protein [unclassified Novosphingobium]|uniref:BadF/BadG/BcrA/BcrD ATPase family protein n=1 Tax=unclassified Novosphingobium TaxID=2644732 RepID=UPI000F5E0D3F|nr:MULTISPECIES: BadF/BadG/BcrA/BcrD ATPase family protein [unclassified Novosphingobium]MBF5092719.1 ATPase [Novosphingobium sp. NBM11]RQW45007.1 ATPase [Novosphingobium sp. LASN5T]